MSWSLVALMSFRAAASSSRRALSRVCRSLRRSAVALSRSAQDPGAESRSLTRSADPFGCDSPQLKRAAEKEFRKLQELTGPFRVGNKSLGTIHCDGSERAG